MSEIEKLEDEIKDFKVTIKYLEDKIEDLKDDKYNLENEIDDLEEEIEELKKGFHLEGLHANNRTQTAIEELFNNLDYIPIAEIENFINTHKKI